MQDEMERIQELAIRIKDIASDAFEKANADNYEECMQLATMEQLAKEIVKRTEDALECPF